MAKKGNRTWVWMVPTDKKSGGVPFQTERNKVNETEKLKVKRFDPKTRTHIEYVEKSK